MAVNTIISTNGKKISMYRTFTENGSLSSTQYLAPSQFKVGVDQADISVSDTDLTHSVPISNGTVNDNGDNQLTGSNGGSNTTDNTTTYKIGGGVTDNTSQDLLATTGNATKTWTISNLATAGAVVDETYYVGLWLYIKDATALAKFLSAGTALEIRLGSDTSNYFSKTYTAANLSTGWNWLDLGVLNTNTETGTVGTPVDTFVIQITTNNADDTFTTGDVIYDLLRSWQFSDTVKDYVSGYPSFNYTSKTATVRCYLNLLEANGFPISGQSLVNEDTSVLAHSFAKFDEESKSDTDEFAFVIKDRWV